MIKQTIKKDERNLRYIIGTMLADFASKRYSTKRLILYTDYIVDFIKEKCRQCKEKQGEDT